MEKVRIIRDRLLAAQSRQKSYADKKRRDLKFEVGDKVFLKISPSKGIMRFGKRGKLIPRYIRPFEILRKVGDVAYGLALPPELGHVHPVFHISMLRRYVHDPSHVLDYQPVHLEEDMTYEEEPVQVLERMERVLRNKTIPMVRILWKNHSEREATWEVKAEVMEKFSHLFSLD